MTIDPELITILRCPQCKGKIKQRLAEASANDDVRRIDGFICDACRLLYPVVDGIPNFLITEATPLEK